MIRIQPTDYVSAECEHLTENKLHHLAGLFSQGAVAGDRYTIILFDHALEINRRAGFKSVIFDLGIERLLPRRVL